MFTGYWDTENPAKVSVGKEVYASCYRNSKGQLLAVVSHLGNERITQDVTINFRGVKYKTAIELMDADDPEYQELFNMRAKHNIPTVRVPLNWQPAGVKVLDFKDNTLKLHLPYHTFALVRLSE